jgi:hypothetical protein
MGNHYKLHYFSILCLLSGTFYATPIPWVKRPEGTALFYLLAVYTMCREVCHPFCLCTLSLTSALTLNYCFQLLTSVQSQIQGLTELDPFPPICPAYTLTLSLTHNAWSFPSFCERMCSTRNPFQSLWQAF